MKKGRELTPVFAMCNRCGDYVQMIRTKNGLKCPLCKRIQIPYALTEPQTNFSLHYNR